MLTTLTQTDLNSSCKPSFCSGISSGNSLRVSAIAARVKRSEHAYSNFSYAFSYVLLYCARARLVQETLISLRRARVRFGIVSCERIKQSSVPNICHIFLSPGVPFGVLQKETRLHTRQGTNSIINKTSRRGIRVRKETRNHLVYIILPRASKTVTWRKEANFWVVRISNLVYFNP